VLQSTYRCSQAPLELSKVLSDSATPFLGALQIAWYGCETLGQLRPPCRFLEDIESSWDLYAALQVTWSFILTVVDLSVPQPQGILTIIFAFVADTRFAT